MESLSQKNGTVTAPDVLTDSAQRTIQHLTEQLRNGFTGRYVIDCKDGGVRRVQEERTLHSVDLAPAGEPPDALEHLRHRAARAVRGTG